MTTLYRARTGETVEARQFISSPAIELDILSWAKTYGVTIIVEHDGRELTHLRIPAAGGEYIAKSGDWIVREGMAEFKPCRPRVVEVTYEAV